MARDVKTLAKNYQLIYEIVSAQDPGTHLSVADVYALAKQRQPGIGETTVYRALARLRDLGMVSEIQLPGADNAFYEPAAPAHAHFRCNVCGEVEDVAYTITPKTIAELASKHSAEVTEVVLSLHGRCSHCKDRGA